jgi:exopolysaccharide biosynthesis polyprenyl glycosylphosphotransferase
MLASVDFGCTNLVYFGVTDSSHGALSYAVRFASLTEGAVAASCVLLSACAFGLYQRQYLWSNRLALRMALALGSALIVMAAISAAVTGRSAWSAGAWIAIAVLWLVGLLCNRVLLDRFVRAHSVKSRVLALCGEADLRAIQDIENDTKSSTFQLVCNRLTGAPDSETSLLRNTSDLKIDEIVVSRPYSESCYADLVACREAGLRITEAEAFVERERGYIAVNSEEAVRLGAIPGRGAFSMTIKRAFDIVVSVALLIFLAPVMIATAIAIPLVNPGPVLYRQTRVGRNGAVFELLKFRSMRADAEADGVARWASVNDTRVTAIGGFLRRSRIDELPQLFNILRGEMSLVGPRPERPEFVRKLVEAEPMFATRHLVLPGITGWAQINFPYCATLQDNLVKAGFDLYYVKHSGVLLDVIISLQTVRVIVMGEGAR